jgi:hypothetical protein
MEYGAALGTWNGTQIGASFVYTVQKIAWALSVINGSSITLF